MIAVTCAACGTDLKAEDDRAGSTLPCPGCGRAVPVPGAAGAEQTAPLPPPDPGSAGSDFGSSDANTLGDEHVPAGSELTDFLAPPQAPDEIGRLGPYRVLQVLGAGGMGVVFQAEDMQLKRQVALKVMQPEAAGKRSARERFVREAQAAAAL